MQALGRGLIVMGAMVTLAGFLVMISGKLGWIGHLPGDIRIERQGFSFYFPLGTCIVISLIISVVIWIMGRFRS